MCLKKLELSLLIAVVFTVLLSCFDFSYQCNDIRNRVFRLHILANSNSEYDQKLKLKVRDRLLNEGLIVFKDSKNLEETILIANNNIDKFCSVAKDELIKNGSNYNVNAEVTNCYFNTRTYSTTTLPAGEYNALEIKIGKAEGRNWWCVMYPSLCVPSSSQKIDDVLPEDETEITQNKDKYIMKFKVIEWFESVKSWF